MKIPKKDKKTLESLFKYDSADEMYFLRNEEGEFIETELIELYLKYLENYN